MDGVFIPKEFYKVKELNGMERDVLALYKYYTEQGTYKYCNMTCDQIADELNISIWYVNKIKKHLKELGFIKTSGIKVFYLGIQKGTTVPFEDTQNCTTVQSEDCTTVQSKTVPQYSGSVLQYRKDCTTVQNKLYHSTDIKKEKKKEIKKEEKWVTNIKLLFARLPKDYHTPERLNYIKDTYKDRLNEVDFNDDSILDTWIPNIKNELNKAFPIEFLMKKEEPKVDFIDVF